MRRRNFLAATTAAVTGGLIKAGETAAKTPAENRIHLSCDDDSDVSVTRLFTGLDQMARPDDEPEYRGYAEAQGYLGIPEASVDRLTEVQVTFVDHEGESVTTVSANPGDDGCEWLDGAWAFEVQLESHADLVDDIVDARAVAKFDN